MKSFCSKADLFSLNVPEEWTIHTEYPYKFTKEGFIEGILQISAFHSKNIEFNVSNELPKVLSKHPSAYIAKISDYDSIQYTENHIPEVVLMHSWIIGQGNIKIFCTFTVNANQQQQKLDAHLLEVFDILQTLKLACP